MNNVPAVTRPPVGAIAAGIVLSIVILLLWGLQLATVASLGRSDAAGNGLGQAYAAIQMIALWALLMVLTILAGAKGAAPRRVTVAALVIVPVSGLVASAAVGLLAQPDIAPFLWPIVIPALVPPLIVAWGLFVLSAARLRSGITGVVAGVLLAAIVAVCVTIWPLSQMRKAVDDREAARLQKYEADLARLPANAPLWDWTPFLDTRDGTKQYKVVDSIRRIDQRQAQAETMLDRGDFPVGYLGSFDLDPTPALCEKARGLLGRRVEPLVLKNAKTPAISGDCRSGFRRGRRHELAGRIWLLLRRGIEGVGKHGEGLCRPQLRRPASGGASRPHAIGTNLARASGTLLDVEHAVTSEGMVEVCR